ncbi:MAG: aminotransferase class IV [Elusimicrobiota bacterium]
MKIYLNGHYISAIIASVPLFDRGILYGEGVFETMRAINGKVPFFYKHYRRFEESARFFDMCLKMSPDGIEMAILKLTHINRLQDAYVRITATGGNNILTSGVLASAARKKCNIFIQTGKYKPPNVENYLSGVTLAMSSIRKSRSSIIIRHKTTCFLENMVAKRNAVKKKCFDALFLDEEKNVAECATSNIFWVKGETIITPSLKCPILPGITRQAVIDIARKLNIRVVEMDEPKMAGLLEADEVFITNSLIGIMPVRKISGRRKFYPAPGKITALLWKLYEQALYN